LQPLSVPSFKWESVSMDFITQLPVTKTGYDAIAVFVDRLTKMKQAERRKKWKAAELERNRSVEQTASEPANQRKVPTRRR
jgi:hypothetical protein